MNHIICNSPISHRSFSFLLIWHSCFLHQQEQLRLAGNSRFFCASLVLKILIPAAHNAAKENEIHLLTNFNSFIKCVGNGYWWIVVHTCLLAPSSFFFAVSYLDCASRSFLLMEFSLLASSMTFFFWTFTYSPPGYPLKTELLFETHGSAQLTRCKGKMCMAWRFAANAYILNPHVE